MTTSLLPPPPPNKGTVREKFVEDSRKCFSSEIALLSLFILGALCTIAAFLGDIIQFFPDPMVFTALFAAGSSFIFLALCFAMYAITKGVEQQSPQPIVKQRSKKPLEKPVPPETNIPHQTVEEKFSSNEIEEQDDSEKTNYPPPQNQYTCTEKDQPEKSVPPETNIPHQAVEEKLSSNEIEEQGDSEKTNYLPPQNQYTCTEKDLPSEEQLALINALNQLPEQQPIEKTPTRRGKKKHL